MTTSKIPKKLTFILGFCFAVEGSLYSAVTPILPQLAREFDLSGTATGFLLSGYSAGLVAGSLLCVLALAWVNTRAVAVASLIALGATTVAFAWTDTSSVLMTARLLQGLSAGICWTACVTWLLDTWPDERRGEALGSSMSFAVFGTMAGPLVGTIALQTGRHVPYTMSAAFCLAAAAIVAGLPRPARNRSARAAGTRELRTSAAGFARMTAAAAAAIATLAGAATGSVQLLGPLTLDEIAGTDLIGGYTFVAAAVIMVAIARPTGILVDRFGAHRMMLLALSTSALLLPLLGLEEGLVVVIVAVVLLVVAINVTYVSAGTMLTRSGEASGWPLQFTIALTGVVWGLGETIGAILSGIGRDAVGPLWTACMGAVIVAIAACLLVVSGVPGGRTGRKGRRPSGNEPDLSQGSSFPNRE